MKKAISIFVSVLFILSLSISTVFAETEFLSGRSVTRGADSAYVSGAAIYNSSLGSYCVNLVSSSPAGVSPGYVGSNHLIFRPYHDNVSAAYAVDFYGTACSPANGNRLYGSYYANLDHSGWYYSIKCSLNSDYISSQAGYSIRWNP